MTLRIEHAIHDYDQWKAAFDSANATDAFTQFRESRAPAGTHGCIDILGPHSPSAGMTWWNGLPSPTHIAARRMSLRRLVAPGALALVIALSVSACGGASNAASQVDGVGAEFGAKALSACAVAQESKDGWSSFPVPGFNPFKPDGSQLPEVGVWLEGEVAPTWDAWLADLRALGQPPTGRGAWTEVLTLVETLGNLNAAQVQAAKDGDTGAFAAATNANNDLQPEFERVAAAASVEKCADVHGG